MQDRRQKVLDELTLGQKRIEARRRTLQKLTLETTQSTKIALNRCHIAKEKLARDGIYFHLLIMNDV